MVNKSIVQNVYKVSNYQSVERKNTFSNSYMNTMAKSVLKNNVNKSDFFSDNDDCDTPWDRIFITLNLI